MVKNLPINAGDAGSILGWERSPGKGNGNPLQYSCLGNPMFRRAWRVTVYGVTKESDIIDQLSMHASICLFLLLFPSGASLVAQQ